MTSLLCRSTFSSLAAGALLTFFAVGCGSSNGNHRDVDAGPGGNDAGGGGDIDRGAIALSELERMTGTLASDDYQGRDEGTAGGDMARAFLIGELTRCGIQPLVDGSYEQPITTGRGANLLGVIPGYDPALRDRHVMISAHFDHIGACGGQICNGADDNAAGVATVVGVACALARAPQARSVMIALWDAEEPPTFLRNQSMGSAYYTQHAVVPLEQIDVAIVLDLVGSDLWPGYEGHFILGAELSPQVLAAVGGVTPPEGLPVNRAGLHLVEETPVGHQPWSDYDAFRNNDRPVLFFSNGQNKRYHTPQDEMEHLNLEKMEKQAAHLLEIVLRLSNLIETPVFDPDGNDYATEIRTMAGVLEAAVAEGGMADRLRLSAASKRKIQEDLANLVALRDWVDGGGDIRAAEIDQMRTATQRTMCFAGSHYDESTCRLF